MNKCCRLNYGTDSLLANFSPTEDSTLLSAEKKKGASEFKMWQISENTKNLSFQTARTENKRKLFRESQEQLEGTIRR